MHRAGSFRARMLQKGSSARWGCWSQTGLASQRLPAPNASGSSPINRGRGCGYSAPYRMCVAGETENGLVPHSPPPPAPRSLLRPAPLCQAHAAASRPVGAALTERPINEHTAPGTEPACPAHGRARAQRTSTIAGLADNRGMWAGGKGHQSQASCRCPPIRGAHPTLGTPPAGHTERSQQSRVLWGTPPGRKAGLETPVSLCLPLQLKEEHGQVSGMSLSGLQESTPSSPVCLGFLIHMPPGGDHEH